MPITATAPPVDWSSRPVVSGLSPQKLASWVDRAVVRTDGMLFTATPTEELDAIGQWQQIKDRAFAGQMRAIVAAYNRASAKNREFAPDEVGLAVGATTTTGGNLVEQALAITALPGLLEAVDVGQLTERHVLAVLRELDKVELSLEQRQAVVLVMLARYAGQAPGELGQLVARLIVQDDRAAAAAREAKATAGRKIWFSRDVDGQALVLGRGPAAMIAAIRASMEATLSDEAAPGDERSREAREFDLFVDLLTGGATAGRWQADVIVPFSLAEGGELELAEIPGLGPVLPATARDLLDQADTISQIAVDQTGTVIAVSDPIPTPRAPIDTNIDSDIDSDTDTATDAAPEVEVEVEREVEVGPDVDVRQNVEVASEVKGAPEVAPDLPAPVLPRRVRQKITAPPSLRDLTSSAYRFPPRLQRFLKTRDRTCVFPGCNRRAVDLDHRIPWPAGKTSADNGECLCRHHHRAKHAVLTVLHDPDGSYVWISRGGWRFYRQPKGY
jgi:hypothetical protein